MALISCPECSKEVSDKAKSCPHCGYELNSGSSKNTKMSKKSGKGTVILTVILFVGIFILILHTAGIFSKDTSNSSSSSSSNVSKNRSLAYHYAKDFVKKQLKSPSTAEFPGIFEKDGHIVELGNDSYKIVSWVDSQNGFGATIRSKFSCTITFNGKQVTCSGLQIE
jgi:hypothetical protein